MSRLSPGLRGDAVADPAALTADALAITFTSNEPTAAAAQTIADGDAPSVAESGQFMANVEQFQDDILADVTALRTKLIALIAALEQAGVIVP